MPQVPISPGRQVQDAPLQGGFQSAPDAGGSARALSGGFDKLADVADKFVQRNDMDVAWTTDAKIKTDAAVFTSQLQQRMRGAAVKGTIDPETGNPTGSYAEQVAAWWAAAGPKYAEGLSAPQRSLIARNLSQSQAAATHAALQHENGERDKAWAESAQAAVDSTTQLALQTGTPAAADVAAQSIRQQITEIAQHKGIVDKDGQLDATWINQTTLAQTTKLHSNMIAQLQGGVNGSGGDPAAALRYFNDHKAEIDGGRHDELGRALNHASAAAEGDNTAQRIWLANGAGTPGVGVQLDKLAEQVRAAYPNDPARQKAALEGIHQRTQDFEHAETRRTADGVNQVYKMIDAKASMAQIVTSPAWTTIGGKEQDAIKQQQFNRTVQLASLAASRETRAAAADSRAWTTQQRAEKQLFLAHGDEYLSLLDPNNLILQDRKVLEAKRSIFGMEPTQHLLAKYDALQKPGAIGEARMDNDQFNAYAQQMGLRPNEPRQSEDQKNALITTRNNVETILANEELQKKRKLTRPEKDEIMQREVARQVTLHNTIFRNTTGVPLIAVPQDRREDVLVPNGDLDGPKIPDLKNPGKTIPDTVYGRGARIMNDALKKATTTADKTRLQPTEENLQRFLRDHPDLIGEQPR